MIYPAKNSLWKYVGPQPDSPEGHLARGTVHRVIQASQQVVTWSEGGLAFQVGWSYMGSLAEFKQFFSELSK